MEPFPWKEVFETGGIFGIAVTLLWLLVDSYKQLEKQRAVVAELTQVIMVKFEAQGAALDNTCTVLGGAVEAVEKALEAHDDRVKGLVNAVQDNRDKIDACKVLLDKVSSDVGRLVK